MRGQRTRIALCDFAVGETIRGGKLVADAQRPKLYQRSKGDYEYARVVNVAGVDAVRLQDTRIDWGPAC